MSQNAFQNIFIRNDFQRGFSSILHYYIVKSTELYRRTRPADFFCLFSLFFSIYDNKDGREKKKKMQSIVISTSLVFRKIFTTRPPFNYFLIKINYLFLNNYAKNHAKVSRKAYTFSRILIDYFSVTTVVNLLVCPFVSSYTICLLLYSLGL